MFKSMPAATRAAWFMTIQCILILFGLIAVPLITDSKQPLGSAGILFVVFFVMLPGVFFWLAGEHRQHQDQIRELQVRIAELERRAPGSGG